MESLDLNKYLQLALSVQKPKHDIVWPQTPYSYYRDILLVIQKNGISRSQSVLVIGFVGTKTKTQLYCLTLNLLILFPCYILSHQLGHKFVCSYESKYLQKWLKTEYCYSLVFVLFLILVYIKLIHVYSKVLISSSIFSVFIFFLKKKKLIFSIFSLYET